MTHNFRGMMPNKVECIVVLFRILNQDIDNEISFAMFLSEVSRLFVISTLSAHGYSSVKIKPKISWRLNKCLQLIHIFQLGIAVEQERRVICGSFTVLVQLLEITNKVMYPLGVEELYHVLEASFADSPYRLNNSIPCE